MSIRSIWKLTLNRTHNQVVITLTPSGRPSKEWSQAVAAHSATTVEYLRECVIGTLADAISDLNVCEDLLEVAGGPVELGNYPTEQLQRTLDATESVVGSDSPSVRSLRQEIRRRDARTFNNGDTH